MNTRLVDKETDGASTGAISIVHGFSRSISTVIHSQSIVMPTSKHMPPGPNLESSVTYHAETVVAALRPKRDAVWFTLGGSTGDEKGPSEHKNIQRGHLDGLQQAEKTTSFDRESLTDTIEPSKHCENVFEDSGEKEDEQSSSAIEDDIEEDWEDEDETNIPSSVNEREMFQRVDSKASLVSTRSLLTSMIHEEDRVSAMQNAASRSTPAIRRSRKSSPNGPLESHAKASTSISQSLEASRARPINMTTSNVRPPALSPRTTRRNMLRAELTKSLREHILWDRQVNRSTTNASLKQRHTAKDMTELQNFPVENAPKTHLLARVPQSVENSGKYNYFDSGLQDYHQRGW